MNEPEVKEFCKEAINLFLFSFVVFGVVFLIDVIFTNLGLSNSGQYTYLQKMQLKGNMASKGYFIAYVVFTYGVYLCCCCIYRRLQNVRT